MSCENPDHNSIQHTGPENASRFRNSSQVALECGPADSGIGNSEPGISVSVYPDSFVRGCLLGLVLAVIMTARHATAQGCVASPNNPCSHFGPGALTNTLS